MDRPPLLPIPTDPTLPEAAPADHRGGNNPLPLVLTLLGAKLATIAIVLWMAWTPEAGLLVAVTTWYWLVVLAALVAGPVLFAVRLRRLRGRREQLRRAEWMVEDAPAREPARPRRR